MLFRNNTIYKRISIYFILFVFLPVMIITSLLFNNIRQQHERITLAASTELANQYKTSIDTYLEQKLDLLNSMSSYNQLTVFLNTPYNARIDFDLYNSTVISYFKGFAGQYYQNYIRLYITNETIPEAHSTIYPIKYLSESTMIQSFIDSSDTTRLFPTDDFSEDNTHDDFFDSKDHVIVLHKIMNYEKLTGIITLKLPENEVFGLNHLSDYKKIATTYYINHSSIPINDLPFNSMIDTSGVLDELAYTKSSIDGFPYGLVIISDSEEPSYYLTLYQLLIIIVLLLASSFMLYEIYKMTKRINSCLTQMNESVQNNFSMNLPVSGNDEITSISKTINGLLFEIKNLIRRTVEQETIGKETQIFALQNQINPHFIYNTMEIFSSQMELFGHFDESDAMSDFAKMLRYNLAGSNYFASVKEEVGHMNSYLNIQKIRFPELDCKLNISSPIYQSQIIRFVFQPIVENSIQHGLKKTESMLHLVIKAVTIGETILFTVSDNGKGMTPDQVNQLNHNFTAPISNGKPSNGNIGLANINNRLRLFYGENSRIHVDSNYGQGTMISFKIPYKLYIEQ